jgi:acylphosphatase
LSGVEFNSLYVTVTGRVQGVGYRAWCVQHAERLGLHGWIRNRHDGSVEAIYQGRGDRLEEMLRLAGEGPKWAKVDGILATPCEPAQVAGFQRRPTY